MTKASDSTKKEGAADFSADFGRLAVEMLENARALPLPPLMVNPAAAMAAATAIGFGFSTQMAGAFFGALQGAMEASSKLAEVLDETPPYETGPEVDVKRENIREAGEKQAPVATKPVVKLRATSRAKKADDLKQISGIGPKLEQVLKADGVRTFADMASWSDGDIARIDVELGLGGRIARDGWVAQAKALSGRGRKRT